jgi:signal transduction histidine kinase/DNA-binding response OmpR family regulator
MPRAATTSPPPGLQSSDTPRGCPPRGAPAVARARGAWRSLLALVAGSLLALTAFASHSELDAEGGVLDLMAPGATKDVHALRGEWRFAWQRFSDPMGTETLPALAQVPGPWNSISADGKPPGPEGFGSYSLEVRCPVGQRLALSVPAQRTAMRLYVNGTLAVSQGDPGASAAEASAAIGRRAVLTDPFACPLRITVHVSNYSHRSGGFVREPSVGPIEELAPVYKQRLALDTILLGAYLVLGIAPLFFYLARRKQKTPVLFGLFCLAQAVYADMTGERLLLQLSGGETPWDLYLKLEYTAWFCSMALFMLLMDTIFPRAMHARVVRAGTAACVLGVLVVVATPARVFSHIVFFGQGLGLALGLYITFAMARAAYQRRNDTMLALAGMAFLLLAVVTNVLQAYAGVTQPGITALGLLGFVLTPAIVLLRRMARALNLEEQRSAEQREKVDLLVRATHAGILDWDYSRNLTRYSPRLLEIMGYPPDIDTTGWRLFYEHVYPADRAIVQDAFMGQLRDRSVRGGEMRLDPHEYRLLRRDGSAVWVHAEAISLRAADGRTLRYICSFLDITDHRAVAEGLQRQNAALAENTRLREDVERMSRHDLKTPLNSIIGVARLLREDAGMAAEHRELLAIAERAGYRMLEMVNLSLDLSRMELGTYDFRPQAVDLVEVISRVIVDLQGLAQSAQVKLCVLPEFAEPVYARAEELLCYSILGNLVKNAIEATPQGGTVDIALEPGEPLRVRVSNPGRVPDGLVLRFFDKYVTAGKNGGTGLGTYSARQMARVQDGELEMRTGDAGTVLTLTLRALGSEQLPPARQHADMFAPRVALGAADFAPRRLLLVDDDEYNRLLLMRYLPSPPFTVDTAGNGLAAIEAAGRHWPDMVLIDQEMPVMNGLETVAWLRERERRDGRPGCLIVMMSSNDDAHSIRRGLEAGSNRYLTKPFTREALLALLHELDRGAAATPQQVPPAADSARPDDHPVPVHPDAPITVDPGLLQEVPAFLDSRRRMVEAMMVALSGGNRAQLRSVAHRAAGGLALFGFQWAAWQSRGISARAAEGDAGTLREDIERLREHLQSVQVQ